MIVTCPNCDTRFNLPDELARPNAQLRCSVCKHVFGIPDTLGHMPGQLEQDQAPAEEQYDEPAFEEAPQRAPMHEEAQGEETEDFGAAGADEGLSLDGDFGSRRRRPAGKSRKGCLIALIILILLAGGGVAAWMFAGDMIKPYLPFSLGSSSAAPTKDLVSKITLRGVRQYSITNEKLGPLSVIEGKAVNGFDEPRELIRVEAALYDKDGKVLDSKQQMAGTSVSLFQLQVLGEKELEQALGNRIEILSNNTNVPPGGEVPFMIVFYKLSGSATEFGVKVTEAKVPPKK